MGPDVATYAADNDGRRHWSDDGADDQVDGNGPSSPITSATPTTSRMTRSKIYALVAVCMMSVGSHLYVVSHFP